jgi:4'-phosphopantetheinyl transferase EntD
MIERVLPECVAAVEAWGDVRDAPLFPSEELVVRGALPARHAEFATARSCARRALGKLGVPEQAIAAGAAGEPCWPSGCVGSITHCRGYRASAVARSQEVSALGIDAEPDLPLPRGVLERIALPAELRHVNDSRGSLATRNPDCLLFCAKEAALKAWFPLMARRLAFARVSVTFDPLTQTFTASSLDSAVGSSAPPVLQGAWLTARGVLLTAVALSSRE